MRLCIPIASATLVLGLAASPFACGEPVTSLSIRPQNAATFTDNAITPYVAVGDSNQLEADARPAQTHMQLQWLSSDPAVAFVTKTSGLLVGITPGTAEITVLDTVTQIRSAPIRFTTMADVNVDGLRWKITAHKSNFNHALAFCASKGWRLPTLTEAHAVRMGRPYSADGHDAFEGPFDSWRFISEFWTSTAGIGEHQHVVWFWDQRGGPVRPIDIPDAVNSHVLCVQSSSVP